MEKAQTLKEKSYVGVKETLLYGVANGGQVIGYNLVRMQLTFFLVTVFGIPAKAVTTMVLVLGFWDAFNDPLMGTIVDKTRSRYGKLRPYLLFVPIPLGIATVLFFGGAEFLSGVESTTAKIIYMCITYFVWEFFYTIGDIPFFEKRWNSKQIIVRITILKAVVTTVIFLIGAKHYTNPNVIVPLLAIQGFFTSAISSIKMVIPTKMIGDTVDYMEWKTGERNEGMSFSLLTFISKLTGSLCTGLATAIIPFIGLESVNNEMVLVETAVNTRFWLWGLVTMIPAVLNLISLIPYYFYDLDNKKLSKIHSEIAVHREKLSKEMTQKHGEED